MNNIPDEITSSILEFSGEGDNIFISLISNRMKELYYEKHQKRTTSYKNIIKSGSRLRNSINMGYKPCFRMLNYIAKYVKEMDNIEVTMKILFDNNVKWDKNSLLYAVEYNNFSYISYVLSTKLECNTDIIFSACATTDNIEIFQMLISMGYEYSHDCVNIAAHYESMKLLKFFIDSNKGIDESFMGIMAENGYLESMKELVDIYGISCNQKTLDYASTGCCVEIIEYLLNNHNCRVTENTIYHSSSSSNPQVRNFFREGYPNLYSEHILDILERYSL